MYKTAAHSAYRSVRDIIVAYRRLAVKLNMRKEGFQYDQSSLNAMKITRLFYDWDETREIELDSKTKRILSKAQELNSKWNSAIKKHGDHYTLSDSSWIKLLDNIEESTLIYLKENKIENIEELWLDRTEIK
jgi:frataxin-like iron-binding protein CyaY